MKLTKENIYDAMMEAKKLLSKNCPPTDETFAILRTSEYDKAVEYFEGLKQGKIKLIIEELILFPTPDIIIESVSLLSGKKPRVYRVH